MQKNQLRVLPPLKYSPLTPSILSPHPSNGNHNHKGSTHHSIKSYVTKEKDKDMFEKAKEDNIKLSNYRLLNQTLSQSKITKMHQKLEEFYNLQIIKENEKTMQLIKSLHVLQEENAKKKQGNSIKQLSMINDKFNDIRRRMLYPLGKNNQYCSNHDRIRSLPRMNHYSSKLSATGKSKDVGCSTDRSGGDNYKDKETKQHVSMINLIDAYKEGKRYKGKGSSYHNRKNTTTVNGISGYSSIMNVNREGCLLRTSPRMKNKFKKIYLLGERNGEDERKTGGHHFS